MHLPQAPVLIVAPHFDDAVLSCAQLMSKMPGCHVVTVMGEGPALTVKTGWNYATTGVSLASAALQTRQAEDAAALRRLQAHQHHLRCWDNEYGKPSSPTEVASAIGDLAKDLGIGSLFLPLGLNHPDHIAVGDAAQALLQHEFDLWLYVDKPYELKYPEQVPTRLRGLAMDGIVLTGPQHLSISIDKSELFGSYASQYAETVRDFPRFQDSMESPELFWRAKHASWS